MSEGQVLHGAHEQVHILRYVGDIRYPLAPSVGRFIDSLLEAKDFQGLVIDLCDASMIDSTNLGQLARVANRLLSTRGQRATLICDQEDIKVLLGSMGLNSLFDIVEHASKNGADEPVEIRSPTVDDLADIMIKAHRTLMELSDENREAFASVVDLLEEQTGQSS